MSVYVLVDFILSSWPTLPAFRWRSIGSRCNTRRRRCFPPTSRHWVTAPSCTSPANATRSLCAACHDICPESACTLTRFLQTVPGMEPELPPFIDTVGNQNSSTYRGAQMIFFFFLLKGGDLCLWFPCVIFNSPSSLWSYYENASHVCMRVNQLFSSCQYLCLLYHKLNHFLDFSKHFQHYTALSKYSNLVPYKKKPRYDKLKHFWVLFLAFFRLGNDNIVQIKGRFWCAWRPCGGVVLFRRVTVSQTGRKRERERENVNVCWPSSQEISVAQAWMQAGRLRVWDFASRISVQTHRFPHTRYP